MAAIALERERAQVRRRMIRDFEEHLPAVMSPLQSIQFARTTLRHGLVFFPIGMYVFVAELNRRVRVIVDMRPTGIHLASFALFNGSTVQIRPSDPPRAIVANYMQGIYATPVIRQETTVHLREGNVDFPITVSLTEDWTTERLVLSGVALQHHIVDVNTQSQTFRLRYSIAFSAIHDFYWHTGLLEQSSSPEAVDVARDLVQRNQNALRESRNRRRSRQT